MQKESAGLRAFQGCLVCSALQQCKEKFTPEAPCSSFAQGMCTQSSLSCSARLLIDSKRTSNYSLLPLDCCSVASPVTGREGTVQHAAVIAASRSLARLHSTRMHRPDLSRHPAPTPANPTDLSTIQPSAAAHTHHSTTHHQRIARTAAHLSVCACACVRVRVCVCVCACMRARVV